MKNHYTRTLAFLVIALFAFNLTSCNDDAFEISNTQLQLSYVDANGLDMLDTTSRFNPKKVDLYYMINGVKTRINDVNARPPENFYVYFSSETNKYNLVIFANTRLNSENKSVTLIDFGTKVDTLQTRFKVWDAGFKIEEVWYNGDLLTSKLDHKVPLTITIDRILTSK